MSDQNVPWRIAEGWAHLRGVPLKGGRVLRSSLLEFQKDRCLERAAALAFTSLLALVPVTAISFSVLAAFSGLAGVREQLQKSIYGHFIPTSSEVIAEYVRQFALNAKGLGIVGILALLVTALLLLNSMERSFNQIWYVRAKRPALAKFFSFWSVLTLTPLLIGASIYLTIRLGPLLPDGASGVYGPLGRAGTLLYPFIMTCAAFFLLYLFLPYTRVGVAPALSGALVSGVLWEAAKVGFKWYVVHLGTFDRVYGPMGVLPLFLIWVYVTWAVVLYGAECSFVVQRGPSRRREAAHASHAEGSAAYYALRIMLEVVRNFLEEGRPTSAQELSSRIGVDEEAIGSLLPLLKGAGLLGRVEGSEVEYLPLRAPERITLGHVLEAAEGMGLSVPEGTSDETAAYLKELFFKMRGRMLEAAEGLDLRHLHQELASRGPRSPGRDIS